MSETLRKVLLGTLIGALIVGFAWHLAGERARRAPASAAPAGVAGAATTTGGKPGTEGARRASTGPAVPVVARESRIERLLLEVEALGTARANESIDVTAKVSNVVTAVRFQEGQQVRKGDVLVELHGTQPRAYIAVTQAPIT